MKHVAHWVTHLPGLGSLDLAITRVLWVVSFALLTGIAAWIKIPLPFTPVPITLQTAVVLASAVMLGRDGVYSQVLYLLLGGVGLPLFAAGSPNGQALFGPTGGYLIGFVLAAALTSVWIHPKWPSLSYFDRCFRLLAVSLVIFIPGVLQLAWFAHLSAEQALTLGFAPFIVGDVLKVFAVATFSKRAIR